MQEEVSLHAGSIFIGYTFKIRLMTSTLFVFAMTRDIFNLTKRPRLHEQWIDAVADYIHNKYGNPPEDVDAIVDPDIRGFVFGVTIAMKLHLPYIPVREAGTISVDEDDDILHATYINRHGKVNLFLTRKFS